MNPALTVFCNVCCSDLNLIISVLGFPLETRSTVSTRVLKAVHPVPPLLGPTQPSPHGREQLTQARHSLGDFETVVNVYQAGLDLTVVLLSQFPKYWIRLHYSTWLIFSSSVRIEPRDLCTLNEHSTSEHLATHTQPFSYMLM